MLHKPAGVISATEDAREKTVIDLIVSRKRKDLFPVGRLDKDTEGLLLITNDGELAHRLLSPKKHVDKTYYAKVQGIVTQEDVRKGNQKIFGCKPVIIRLPLRLTVQKQFKKQEEDDGECRTRVPVRNTGV